MQANMIRVSLGQNLAVFRTDYAADVFTGPVSAAGVTSAHCALFLLRLHFCMFKFASIWCSVGQRQMCPSQTWMPMS